MKRFFFLIGCMFPFFLAAQDGSNLSLERIFVSDEFDVHALKEVRWIEGGRRFTVLESAPGDEDVLELVAYNTKSGSREVIVDASRLIPKGETKPLIVEGYEWSSNGTRLLLFTNTRRVWRRNTRGDYWILDMQTGRLSKLGRDFPLSSLMFAKFSPDGERVAYVCANNLYTEDLSGNILPLTRDGSGTIINGTFDWVYEEELGLRDGFRWSPDGKRIAYWQLDTEGVGIFYMINNTDSLYSRLIPIPYPKAGTVNSACRVGIVSSEGGETRWVNLPGDPRNQYIAHMDWAGNSKEILFQVLNRLQNTNQLWLADAETGAALSVVEDRDEAWIDPVDDCIALEDGSFFWVSEQSGFRHAYRLLRDGKRIPVTRGDWEIIEIAGIDQKGGWLYFYASPLEATQQFLYRSLLTGKGSPEKITPMRRGTHQYEFSPDFRFALHTASNFDEPPKITLVRMPDHRIVHSFSNNDRLNLLAGKLDRKPVRFFRIDTGGNVLLDGWEILPPDFDPDKKYPVLFYVYGEPIGQTVKDAWG